MSTFRHMQAGLFQSTHPRGVRLSPSMRYRVLNVFQSTPPRGVRLAAEVTADHRPAFQSTRPRRARPQGLLNNLKNESFNPRTPWGATRMRLRHCASGWFQSTHPRGVRLIVPVTVDGDVGFNPRTPVGCDSVPPGTSPSCRCFNPRTPVGYELFYYYIISSMFTPTGTLSLSIVTS